MEQRQLPFSRIRLGAREYQAAFRIAHTTPTYPADAKRERVEGVVILDAVMGKSGEIQSLSVHARHPILAESALQAVRSWACRPTLLNGIPVEVQTQIEITFRVPDPA